MAQLDEKGFVFSDLLGNAYHCKVWAGEAWFFSWHPDNKWVSVKKPSQMEVWVAESNSIPTVEAEIYHKKAELAN